MTAVLIEVNKGIGVLVAIIGSLVVAPGAVPHLWNQRLIPLAARVKERLRSVLSRFIPALRRYATVEISDGMIARDDLSASLQTSWPPWHVGASEVTIGQVQKRVDELVAMLNRLEDKTDQDRYELQQRIAALESQLGGKLTKLNKELEKDRQQDIEVNANGLPLITTGIVLTAIPDWLAELPYGLGWIFPAGSLLLMGLINTRSNGSATKAPG